MFILYVLYNVRYKYNLKIRPLGGLHEIKNRNLEILKRVSVDREY